MSKRRSFLNSTDSKAYIKRRLDHASHGLGFHVMQFSFPVCCFVSILTDLADHLSLID